MKAAILSIVILALSSMISFGQSKMDQWPELKSYHTVLSETFHPSEKGDLKPIKTRSHELSADAKMIVASPIPEEFDNEKVKNALARLVKESDKLNALVVRQEQDMTIVKQLNKVHDAFHDIVGLCNKKEASNP
jgi:hypothetical protein